MKLGLAFLACLCSFPLARLSAVPFTVKFADLLAQLVCFFERTGGCFRNVILIRTRLCQIRQQFQESSFGRARADWFD